MDRPARSRWLGIVVDCAHASYAAALAVLETSDQPVIISHGQLGRPGAAHPRLLTTAHVAAVASAGGLIGAWPAGLTSRSLADFGTEIIRLTDIAGPGHVAIGTDLDGNYRPVLTSYHQLADLAGLLLDRGLPAADVWGVLGGNAMDLLAASSAEAGYAHEVQAWHRSSLRNAFGSPRLCLRPSTGMEKAEAGSVARN